MVDHHALNAANVAVGEAEHQPVGQRVQLLTGAGLRDAGAAAAGRVERRHRQLRRADQAAVGAVGPVDLELPESQRGLQLGQQVVGRPGGRRRAAVEVSRQQAAVAGAQLKALLGCRQTRQHLAAVIGAGAGASKGLPIVEHVEGDVVGIRPDSHLRVVVEGGVREGIAVVGTGCVRGGRHRHTLPVAGRAARHRKLRQHPAVGHLVVLHDRVTVVAGLASATKPGKQRIARLRVARCQCAGGFVEDRDVGIDPLHVLRRTHSTRGVGRRVARAVAAQADTHAVKAQARGRCRCGTRPALQHRISGRARSIDQRQVLDRAGALLGADALQVRHGAGEAGQVRPGDRVGHFGAVGSGLGANAGRSHDGHCGSHAIEKLKTVAHCESSDTAKPPRRALILSPAAHLTSPPSQARRTGF